MVYHKKQWEFLEASRGNNRLAHAYLFSGPRGIGKKTFALEFLKAIDCRFPDLMVVGEKNTKDPVFGDGGEIKISQVREIQNFLGYKSYNGGFKAVVVDESEKMNQEAQSCFLKTLEEPKGNTLIILISSKPDILLSTITSRCQTIKFFKTKDLPVGEAAAQKEKKILQELRPVVSGNLAEKFKYVKNLDLEKQSAGEIVLALQKHYRKKLFENFADKKVIEILKKTEEISQKLLFTNANQKLALELILMEL